MRVRAEIADNARLAISAIPLAWLVERFERFDYGIAARITIDIRDCHDSCDGSADNFRRFPEDAENRERSV